MIILISNSMCVQPKYFARTRITTKRAEKIKEKITPMVGIDPFWWNLVRSFYLSHKEVQPKGKN